MCDFHYIIHELLADGADFLREGSAEHHHLLLMGCGFKHLLYIPTHICTLKDDKHITTGDIFWEFQIEHTICLPSWSSILSHSSKMKCLRCFVLRVLSRTRAKILPGVPTTICGQLFFSVSSSFLMEIPPKNTEILIPSKYLLNRSYSL